MNTEQNNRNKITEFELISYFKAELSEDDRGRVEAWIDASEENRALAENIYTIIFADETLHTINNISAHDALRQVNKKITLFKFRQGGKWLQRIAAILFIPLLITTIYLSTKDLNDEPEYISLRTNPGIVADFKLPDGTKVWLNALSTLTYPAKFSTKNRKVELSGEAYFDVETDKKRPFIVGVSNNIEVEATGTEFNIDAYDNFGQITATLAEGSIKMRYPDKETGIKTQILKPEEKIVFDKNSGNIMLTTASTLVETGWKDGLIYLENTPLEHLLHTLSKRFNANFVLENNSLKENYFTGVFGTQDLKLILQHLEISSGIKHHVKMPAENDPEARITIRLY